MKKLPLNAETSVIFCLRGMRTTAMKIKFQALPFSFHLTPKQLPPNSLVLLIFGCIRIRLR